MPDLDAPSADVRLPSPAEAQAADALRARLRAAFPPGRAYRVADLNTPAMPAAVGRFIVQALQRRLVMEREALRDARSDWFDHDAPAVEAAWDDLVDALGAHARVPADEWPRALDQAAGQVAAFLLRPAPTLAAFVFADGAPDLPVGVILRRMSYFTSYPYLRDVVAAYVEQRGLDRLDRATFASLLERVERRTPSAYRGQWTTLFADLYATLGTGTPATLPAALLAPTLADRGLTALAQHLATDDRALTLDDLARIVDADPAGARSTAPRNAPAASTPLTASPDASGPKEARPPAEPVPDFEEPPTGTASDDAWRPTGSDDAPTADLPQDDVAATEPAFDAHAAHDAAEVSPDDAPDAERSDRDVQPDTDGPDAHPDDERADDTAAPDGATWRMGAARLLVPEADSDEASSGPAFDWRGLPDAPQADDANTALAHDIPEPAPPGAATERASPESAPWDEATDAPTLPASTAPEWASPREEASTPESSFSGPWSHLDAPANVQPPPAPGERPIGETPAAGSPSPAPAPFAPSGLPPEPARPVSLADRPVASLDPLPPVASRTPSADTPDDDERPLWQRVLRRETPPAAPTGRADDLDALEARTLGAGARTRRDSFVSGLFGGDAAAYAAALAQLDAVSSWPDAAGVLLGLFRTRGVDLYDPTAVAFTDAAEQRYL